MTVDASTSGRSCQSVFERKARWLRAFRFSGLDLQSS